jgi:hypothetical protein
LRIGIGRVDDLDPAFAAGWYVDVIQPDARAADHLQLWSQIEQGVINLCIGTHHQCVSFAQRISDRRIIVFAPSNIRPLAEPVNCFIPRTTERFGDENVHWSDPALLPVP